MVVEIQVKKKEKEKRVCELCGKSDGLVDIWIGVYINYAHHKCAEIAGKGVERYLKYLILRLNGLEILVADLTKAQKELEMIFSDVRAKATIHGEET